MKKEKFQVVQKIRELIIAIDEEMKNYPKKDVEIKNRIRTNTYDLLEIGYEANASTDIEYKKKSGFKMLAKIKVIDFLLNLSYDRKLISEKRYYSFGRKLDDIAKYINGWFKTLI